MQMLIGHGQVPTIMPEASTFCNFCKFYQITEPLPAPSCPQIGNTPAGSAAGDPVACCPGSDLPPPASRLYVRMCQGLLWYRLLPDMIRLRKGKPERGYPQK